jgi:tetratricopeptide (TPR) repeat protein
MNEKLREVLLQEVKDLAAAGDAAAGAARLKQALAADPRFYAGWIRLGQLLYEERAYPEAVRAVRAAEQCDPLQAEFRSIQAAMQRRDFSGASATAGRMLEIQPGHPRAVFTLAHIAGLTGDDDARIAVLKAGLDASPANLFLSGLLLAAQEEAGHYRDALATARRIAGIEGGFEGHWGLANTLFRFGKNAEALDACDRAGGDEAQGLELGVHRGLVVARPLARTGHQIGLPPLRKRVYARIRGAKGLSRAAWGKARIPRSAGPARGRPAWPAPGAAVVQGCLRPCAATAAIAASISA